MVFPPSNSAFLTISPSLKLNFLDKIMGDVKIRGMCCKEIVDEKVKPYFQA
jgi:hypothetical protein